MSVSKPKTPISYHYTFTAPDGQSRFFHLKLDGKTLDLIPDPATSRAAPPSWTQLTHNQCPNCPLKPEEHPHCPLGSALHPIIKSFSGFVSYEKMNVKLETEERTYTKETTVQKGLSSLMGIYMVSSGCPILNKLRPMVRHHLPFASLEETQYRVLSMYALSQFMRARKGLEADWSLENLTALYQQIEKVNASFCRRLHGLEGQDAVPNAITTLNTFGINLLLKLSTEDWESLETLFDDYLKQT